MNPLAMLSLLVAALAAFAWSAARRWQLLTLGTWTDRFDRIPERVGRVLRYGIKQEKMHKYRGPGAAHLMIFSGFMVLLLRTLILGSRGFSAGTGFFLFNPGQEVGGLPLGDVYGLIKDVFALLVLGGASYFFYLRVAVKPQRMNLSKEGLLIVCIIMTMMIADVVYDGAAIALDQGYRFKALDGELRASVDTVIAHRKATPLHGVHFDVWEPAGSVAAIAFASLPPAVLVALAHGGFWLHLGLVLLFLNLLPHSKHFHVITALPNIFFSELGPRGRLPFMGNSEKIMETLGAVTDQPDPIAAEGMGRARIEHFNWKQILDFYTCTECGRCSDNCPAHNTGKLLSPKHLTLDLRNHLYARETEFIASMDAADPKGARDLTTEEQEASTDPVKQAHEAFEASEAPAEGEAKPKVVDLVNPSDPAMGVIHPDVIWSCTSCRACEEQCPVLISYVDKITEMRRNVVMVRGEFPHELQRPFTGIETNGNPWNLSRLDRAAWSEGLDVKVMAEHPETETLFWVGCSASYDDRAKKIARATAKLLKAAGVDFAILGQEESCTGDPARRAGNEYLFATMAEANIAVLDGYGLNDRKKKKIVTTCPHCFNTLANEYPDFGGTYEVVHHTELLLSLLKKKKLTVKKKVAESLVFHDSCYLGRYNDVYDAPREILERIGAQLKEAEWSRSKGLCCGAGGAQMFMEEKGTERVNKKRTLQLLETGAKTIASACPFCMTMLTDGLKNENLEDSIKQLDVAELLAMACQLEDPKPGTTEETEASSKVEEKSEEAAAAEAS
jgi:Fe-S oxidoreductase